VQYKEMNGLVIEFLMSTKYRYFGSVAGESSKCASVKTKGSVSAQLNLHRRAVAFDDRVHGGRQVGFFCGDLVVAEESAQLTLSA